MSEQAFELVEQCLETGGSGAGLDFLVKKFRDEKQYPQLFEARLMKKRHELGLPLIHTGPLNDLPEQTQRAYDEGSTEIAREVGHLFLAEGDIERAWPYFRAIGEAGPIREAIEALDTREDLDGIIEIAYHERVNPRKGFELALSNYGTCRAITYFGQYPSEEGRDESARLLTKTLYDELAENLKRTIEKNPEMNGDKLPAANRVSELIEGRDWLFEGNSYFIDTSHVSSIVQYAVEWRDPETLQMAVELCSYGKRLGEMFQFKGQPPFEDVFADHEVYLKALLGDDVDGAITHFRAKVVESDPDEVGTAPAQTLVKLLTRLERYGEAVDIFREFLGEADPAYLACPNPRQLCQMGGDYDRLRELAREEGDLLSFTAASIQG
jgi:tetratricopeptide (TPR) repeat protein